MSKNPEATFKKASNNKMKIHNSIIFSILVFILIISFFTIVSCSGLIAPDTRIDIQPEDLTEDNIEESVEDTMPLEEETIPEIDYQNASIGAEMEGAIPSFLCTNIDNFIKIKITNTSDFTWRNERPGVVRIGYHYYGTNVDYIDYDGTQRTVLPKYVEPGETVTVLVLINDIVNPGIYVVQIDPVLEGNEIPEDNFWFSSKGVEMIQNQVFFEACGSK